MPDSSNFHPDHWQSFLQRNRRGTVRICSESLHFGIFTNCNSTATLDSGTFTSPLVSPVGEMEGAGSEFNINGGTAYVSSLLNVGSNDVLASVSVNGGALYVTNGFHTANTIVNGGFLRQDAGLFMSDNLIVTNGGTLVTLSDTFFGGKRRGVTNSLFLSSATDCSLSAIRPSVWAKMAQMARARPWPP